MVLSFGISVDKCTAPMGQPRFMPMGPNGGIRMVMNVIRDDHLAELLILTCVVNEHGTAYYNSAGQLHRIHGPAIIWPDGSTAWCLWDTYYTRQEHARKISGHMSGSQTLADKPSDTTDEVNT